MRKALVQTVLHLPINPEHTPNALKYLIVQHVAVPERHKTVFVTGVEIVHRVKVGLIRRVIKHVVATKKIVVLAEIKPRLYIRLKIIKNCI